MYTQMKLGGITSFSFVMLDESLSPSPLLFSLSLPPSKPHQTYTMLSFFFFFLVMMITTRKKKKKLFTSRNSYVNNSQALMGADNTKGVGAVSTRTTHSQRPHTFLHLHCEETETCLLFIVSLVFLSFLSLPFKHEQDELPVCILLQTLS